MYIFVIKNRNCCSTINACNDYNEIKKCNNCNGGNYCKKYVPIQMKKCYKINYNKINTYCNNCIKIHHACNNHKVINNDDDRRVKN